MRCFWEPWIFSFGENVCVGERERQRERERERERERGTEGEVILLGRFLLLCLVISNYYLLKILKTG
jgi:hypothetical protein